jgi:hypothetical protein
LISGGRQASYLPAAISFGARCQGCNPDGTDRVRGRGDPVAWGLVASLARPGDDVISASFFAGVLGAKRLDLLRQLLPKATTIETD